MIQSATVLAARPDVFNHNLETVRRLTPNVRSRATYDGSLLVLRKVKDRVGSSISTKSGLMLGLGEKVEEVLTSLADLRAVGCDIVTLGQYLQPSLKHLNVVEYIHPDQFAFYGQRAREMGFVHVASAPMVRSSYHADDFTPVVQGESASTSRSMRSGKTEGVLLLLNTRTPGPPSPPLPATPP